MPVLRTTGTAGSVTLAQPLVDAFGRSLKGALLTRSAPDYDERRRVWNRMIDRRPALIARAAVADDVVKAVRFAQDHDLLISVRGGGHNVTGNAVCEGGLMIDLSSMRATQVDPARRIALADPGQNWGDFDGAVQRYGLVTTGGIVSTTGLAGLTLGGGHGWLTRKHGLTCDNLVSVDLVTAAGNGIHASAEENSDLFWAVRGGGGNFGVVTRFEFQLHPLEGVWAGLMLFPQTRAKEVLEHYFACAAVAPDELTLYVIITTWHDGAPVIAIVACYSGAMANGEKALSPLKTIANPLLDTIGPTTYGTLQTMFDATNPPDAWYYKTGYCKDQQPGSAPFIDTLLAHCDFPSPSPLSRIVIEHLGGAMARVPADATAFAHRDASFDLIFIAGGFAPEATERNRAWARTAWEAMRPFLSGGAYVNYLDGDEGAAGLEAAYYGPTQARLAAIKARYDPDNRFRLNQNIKPARS